MRICFFNTVKFWGGGEKFYLEYAQGMKKRGHEVVIVCDKKSELQKRAERLGIATHNVSISMWTTFNLFKKWRLIKYLRKKSFDFILCSTSQDLKIVAQVAPAAGIEKIGFRRGLAVPIKRTILSEHIFSNIVTHILANSQKTKDLILQNISDLVPSDRVQVVYNGIDIRRKPLNFLPAIVKRKKGIIIGNAGRLTAQKRQEDLITLGVALLKSRLNFSIFIAGTGEEKENLESKISEAGLQNHIHLLGFVSEMDSFMQSIDIFILTSEWEGFGYVMVEAMKYGKPVIAYNISNIPEIIADEKTGYIIEPYDIDSMRDKVITLAQDPKLRLEMGKNAQSRVKEKFDFKQSLIQFEQWVNS